jgi:hypothetical protein
MIAVWGFWRSPVNGLGGPATSPSGRAINRPLLCCAGSFRELVPKHGHSTLRFVFGSFVLNCVPVLGENVVFDTENVGHNPVNRQTHARIPTVNDREISLGDDRARFILKRWLNVLSVLKRAPE